MPTETVNPPGALQRGRLIILSAPSGAGKTSLAHAVIAAGHRVVLSVSHTTRAPRPGEVDGEDYFFVDFDVFRSMIDDDAFLEYAEVFGNYYGTSVAEAESKLEQGFDVILDIDWQGARKVRERLPDAFSIFILPPSLAALRERLNRRGQDSEAVIESRMQKAISEISHYGEYDCVVINNDFDLALAELKAVIAGGSGGVGPADIDIERFEIMDKNVTLTG